MITIRQLRAALSGAHARTWFCRQTNETHYPAEWTYGAGAGSATTSCHYDRRWSIAAAAVAKDLDLGHFRGCDESQRAALAALVAAREASARADSEMAAREAAEANI